MPRIDRNKKHVAEQETKTVSDGVTGVENLLDTLNFIKTTFEGAGFPVGK